MSHLAPCYWSNFPNLMVSVIGYSKRFWVSIATLFLTTIIYIICILDMTKSLVLKAQSEGLLPYINLIFSFEKNNCLRKKLNASRISALVIDVSLYHGLSFHLWAPMPTQLLSGEQAELVMMRRTIQHTGNLDQQSLWQVIMWYQSLELMSPQVWKMKKQCCCFVFVFFVLLAPENICYNIRWNLKRHTLAALTYPVLEYIH